MSLLYTPGEVHPELVRTFERAVRDELDRRYPKNTLAVCGFVFLRGRPTDVIHVSIATLGQSGGSTWNQALRQEVLLESYLSIDGVAAYIVDKWEDETMP